MGPFDGVVQQPTRADVRKQRAQAFDSAMWERGKAKRAQKKGPRPAQTSGTARQRALNAPTADDAVGPMQSILQQGLASAQSS